MSTLAGAIITHADERHLGALMTVMRASFDPHHGEAWSTRQLGGTMGMGSSFARQAVGVGDVTIGFTLCRAAGPEVELLLIAVHPQERGHGLGHLLLQTACNDALQRGASEVFLEVRENNAAARGLYQRSGFIEIGRRADYYAGSSGDRFAAITMRRNLQDLIL